MQNNKVEQPRRYGLNTMLQNAPHEQGLHAQPKPAETAIQVGIPKTGATTSKEVAWRGFQYKTLTIVSPSSSNNRHNLIAHQDDASTDNHVDGDYDDDMEENANRICMIRNECSQPYGGTCKFPRYPKKAKCYKINLQPKRQQQTHDSLVISIISILQNKQPNVRDGKQHQQPYKYQRKCHQYSMHWYKISSLPYKDLTSIISALLLIFILPQLFLNLVRPVAAGCRDEPSRSCEAICRPGWLKADNHNHYDTTHQFATNDNETNDVLTVFSSSSSGPTTSLVAYNCTIRALVLLPDNNTYITSLRSVVPILKVAEQHIHESGLLPPYIRFDWMPQDDKCDAAFAVVKAMDAIVKNCAHVVFGPTCDYSLAAVGRIAKYFNSNGTPLISVGGSTFDFEKQKTTCSDEFYMLLRTGMLSFETISELTISVMKRHKWSRSIFFYDPDGQHNVAGLYTCYLMMNSLGNQMRKENMTFAQYPIKMKLMNRTEEMTREIGNKHSGKLLTIAALREHYPAVNAYANVCICV